MSRSYANTVLEAMQDQPVVLVAAGVSLFNDSSELLLLQRPSGEWDLSGGHHEPGESLEQTARRELLEETGLCVGTLELLGIASGQDIFQPQRNAYYVTAICRAKGFSGTLKLSDEHIAASFSSLKSLPTSQATAVRELVQRLLSKEMGSREN